MEQKLGQKIEPELKVIELIVIVTIQFVFKNNHLEKKNVQIG